MTNQQTHPEENPVYDYGPEKPKRGIETKFEDTPWSDGRAIGGLVLIGLGLVFLVESFFDLNFEWWALFLLVPGVALLINGWRAYSQDGYLNEDIKGQTFGGVMLVLLGSIFLLELDWGKVWPLFLIIPGIGLLLGWIGGDEGEK